jgi:ElaB protein
MEGKSGDTGLRSFAFNLRPYLADKQGMNREELIAEIKKQLQEELKHFTQPLADKIPHEHKEKANDVKNEVAGFVKENPWAAVGIAVLAGLLLGRLFYKRGGDE